MCAAVLLLQALAAQAAALPVAVVAGAQRTVAERAVVELAMVELAWQCLKCWESTRLVQLLDQYCEAVQPLPGSSR